MHKADKVFRELGQLYEFQKELSKCRLKKKEQPSGSASTGKDPRENASPPSKDPTKNPAHENH